MTYLTGGIKRFVLWVIGLTCAFLFGQNSETFGAQIQEEGEKSRTVQQKPQLIIKYGVKPQSSNNPQIIMKYGVKPQSSNNPQIIMKYGVKPQSSNNPQIIMKYGVKPQ